MPLGTVIGGVLSGYIVANYGWRSVFYIFGVAGVIVAALSWRILRDRPQDHPRISPGELDRIESSIMKQDGEAALTAPGSSLGQIVRNPIVWVCCAVYFAIVLFMWGNLNWLPTYFMKARGSSIMKSGFYSAIPFMGAVVGPPVLGWLSDRGILIKTRSGWVCLSLTAMVPLVLYAVLTPTLTVSLACFTLACFFAMASMGMMYTFIMEVFERANIAKVSGFMLGSGSIAGIIAPVLIGFVLEATNSFNYAYYIFAMVAFAGAAFSLPLIRAEKAAGRSKAVIGMQVSEEVA
jgi:sugar phosphate permease